MRRCWLYSILAWGLLCLGASEASARLGASRFFPGLYYPDAPQEADAQVIDVAENAGFDSADLSLSPAGGTLTGEVVGPDGPAVGLLVQAWVGTIRVDGRTDDSGRFSLEGVPAGSVLLRFSSDAPYSRDRAHAAAYLGGVDAPDQSPRIELADQESKDIGHQTLEWGAILGGRVMTPEGFGLEGARIRIEDGAGGFWSTETGPQGRWRQGGLAAGSYLVEVTPPSGPYLSEFFGGARTSDEAALVSATVPSERLDLDVDLDVGGEIDGRVRNETGSPYPDFEVEFEDRDRGTVFKTRTEDHGEYAMTGLPAGSYYVFVPRLNRYFPSAVHVEDARTVTVAEGAVAGRVDVIGFDLGDCRLSNDGRGVIHGVLDVDFAYTDAVVVTALSPSDTVETAFHDPGAYSLDCVPPGDYLVRFVAQGGYPRLFHPGVPDEAQAVRVTVAGDTAMAVDYLPDRSTWIAGRVLDAESNTPIGAVRVSARSTNGRVVASALTEADGFYRIETLPDGSGLPAGSYRVLAESTLVPDPDVTPVLQPTVSARQDGDQ
ncbi:MAG: carboxypeptidase regulatory-like domain-containing protein, partial [Candidatus Eisenbacteria bacterium]|nr:carboxypeptidase regulatory-like domain-containing protein [Candidatus Eisenbacteria bacterium]